MLSGLLSIEKVFSSVTKYCKAVYIMFNILMVGDKLKNTSKRRGFKNQLTCLPLVYPRFFFQRLDKLEQFEKDRRHVEWLSAMQIIIYLHSVSLLWIRQITIWKWAEKHSGQEASIMNVWYVAIATYNHAYMLINMYKHTFHIPPDVVWCVILDLQTCDWRFNQWLIDKTTAHLTMLFSCLWNSRNPH